MHSSRLLPMGLALALSACTAAPPAALDYAVSIDPTFTADEVDAVTSGLDDWSKAVPQLHLSSVIASCDTPAPGQVCLNASMDPPSDPGDEIVGTTYRGAAESGTILIYVARILAVAPDAMALTKQTVEHELGHAMGLQHTATGTLMAADVGNQAPSVTQADVAQFWNIRNSD
jgi:hypothetical protein